MSLAATSRVVSPAFAAALVLGAATASAQVRPHAGMMRYPDVSETHIVFVYANDLWLAPREGGMAVPLASPPGQETFPRFSPDGQTIAFVGNYDGNRDLYTISIHGGVPRRVTHHPSAETLCDWVLPKMTLGSNGHSAEDDASANAKLLFFTSGFGGLTRMSQLFLVDQDGGLPEQLPIPYGTFASISVDGKWLAYTPHTTDHRTWKRYRGGMATDIWLFNLETHEARKITDWEGTDTQPMWSPSPRAKNSTLYYLSDAGDEHRLNIWSYDVTGERRQLTRFKDHDVKWPSIGPGENGQGEIVFQNGSGLYLLDLSTNASKRIDVVIPGDRPTIRNQTINAADFINGWGISSTGKRAVIEARGDIWTSPADEGSPRNLTRTSGVAERDPAWSPDGRWISYFSDETGEYELYITQSDGRGETRQLTRNGDCFRYNLGWSPDSKHILFADKTGAIYLYTIDSEETKLVDRDPWANGIDVSWSHDSRWIAYARSLDDTQATAIFIYHVPTGQVTQATSGMFNDSSPAFDRKGDYLYFVSNRAFSPTYGDIPLDTTFIYENSGVLLAVPLRADMEYVWTPKSDEEKWDEKADKQAEDNEDTNEENVDHKQEDHDDGDDDQTPAAVKDDGVSGTWSGTATTPDGPLNFTLTLTLTSDNSVTGTLSTPMGNASISGTYSPGHRSLTLTAVLSNGLPITLNLVIDGQSMSGTGSANGQEAPVTATRIGGGDGGADDDAHAKGDGKKDDDKPRKEVTIDFEGFERRAFPLPVPNGQYGRLAVNHANQLIYARLQSAANEGSGRGIYLFDLKDDKKDEKTVAPGAANFDISADGKKLLVLRGRGSAVIQNASANSSGDAKSVITTGMNAFVNPREEWAQMFNEAWRLQRDFFYVANMHGVDWPAVRDHYQKMLADCVNREDVGYVISEMISELNVGHAYYSGGDVEDEPSMSVGLLGCDFALENGAYRITKIYEGGPWDSDARGPLSAPGIKVKQGDYLLAVNGVPVDTSKDPWAPFVGLAGQVVSLTICDNPEKDDTAREVLVRPLGSETELRYRAWIERNRKYVEDKTDGQVGYIYVPNTGRDGQNDLFRQFFGQVAKKALIIDERWNGGGQIPTRFIELLNRPRTNYWARRDGKDWTWPPDSHQGPKCMLINGLAGSGGDMFPWLFKQAGLGPLIGTRTWGGLVGISGNPGLIDGARVTVPTFGFYETDGTWGVEGHGTEPDIEVIDDPSLMTDGGDPQLDKAIEIMLQAIKTNGYTPATRPADPDRSGFGIRDEDK